MNNIVKHALEICAVAILLCSVHATYAQDEQEAELTIYQQVILKLENLKPNNPIEVLMAMNQEAFEIDEKVELRFRASEDSYVTLMNLSANGDIAFLFPNVKTQEHYVEGNRVYSTLNDFKLALKASPPEGVEIVNLFCTKEAFDLFQTNFENESFYAIRRDDEARLRALLTTLEHLDTMDWSGSSVKFRIGSQPLVQKGVIARSAPDNGFGSIVPPIATTGSTGKQVLFPPMPTTGSTGHTDNSGINP